MYFGTKSYLKNNHYHTTKHLVGYEHRVIFIKVHEKSTRNNSTSGKLFL
jgi:hypothetical protein